MQIPVRDHIAAWPSRKRTAAGAIVILAVVALNLVYTQRVAQRQELSDLHIYTAAVSQWWQGGDLYAWGLLPPAPWAFTYPPFAAIIMAPMAVLPWTAVSIIQALASAAATTLTLALLLRRAAQRRRWWLPALVAGADLLLLPIQPLILTLSFGQINLLLLALVAVDLLAALPRHHVLAGVGIGLATAVKLTPAVFIVYLLIVRERRAALVAAGTAGLVTLAAAAMMPHESVDFWTSKIFDIRRVGEPALVDNQSLNGVVHRLTPHAATLLWAAAAVAVLAVWLWRAGRRAEGADPLAGFALTAVVACLISPVTWVTHLVWLIPAIVVLADRMTSAAGPLRRRIAVLAVLLGSYGLMCTQFISHPHHGFAGFLTTNLYVWVSLALLVALPLRPPERAPGPVSAESGVPLAA
jgi:alpha-1,2-mannosyltransferase